MTLSELNILARKLKDMELLKKMYSKQLENIGGIEKIRLYYPDPEQFCEGPRMHSSEHYSVCLDEREIYGKNMIYESMMEAYDKGLRNRLAEIDEEITAIKKTLEKANELLAPVTHAERKS